MFIVREVHLHSWSCCLLLAALSGIIIEHKTNDECNRMGEMNEQEKPLQIGTVLEGRYRIVSEGTARDIGVVYTVYDTQHDRLATMVLLARRFGGDIETVARLVAANQAVADLTQPALLPLDHVGLADGQVYLVRSHIETQTLADLLAQSGSLKVEAAVEIAIHLCEALAPAHRAGLVHGSLAPQSVLLGKEGQVTVIDTGLVPALRPVPAQPGQPWGRFPYLSPEQAAGEDVHPASDVYILGSLLYEMLLGRPLFHADDETSLALQHLRHEPVPLRSVAPLIPPPLAQIVHKALAKEPAARYRNAGQLAHILRSHVESRLGRSPITPMPLRPGVAREQMLVPPLSMPEETYESAPGADYWTKEDSGVDWIMVGLIIVALVAMLGLIPLWRTVYRRYAVPPPAPTAVPYRGSGQDMEEPSHLELGRPNQRCFAATSVCIRSIHPDRNIHIPGSKRAWPVNQGAKLDGPGLVWYNMMLWHLGVQLTGWRRKVWYTEQVMMSGGKR